MAGTSLEAEVFRKCFIQLKRGVCPWNDIADELYQEEVISDMDRRDVLSKPKEEQGEALVSRLQLCDADTFHKLVAALKHAPTERQRKLAQLLVTTLQELQDVQDGAEVKDCDVVEQVEGHGLGRHCVIAEKEQGNTSQHNTCRSCCPGIESRRVVEDWSCSSFAAASEQESPASESQTWAKNGLPTTEDDRCPKSVTEREPDLDSEPDQDTLPPFRKRSMQVTRSESPRLQRDLHTSAPLAMSREVFAPPVATGAAHGASSCKDCARGHSARARSHRAAPSPTGSSPSPSNPVPLPSHCDHPRTRGMGCVNVKRSRSHNTGGICLPSAHARSAHPSVRSKTPPRSRAHGIERRSMTLDDIVLGRLVDDLPSYKNVPNWHDFKGKVGCTYRAMFDWTARKPGDLSYSHLDMAILLGTDGGYRWRMKSHRRKGWVLASHWELVHPFKEVREKIRGSHWYFGGMSRDEAVLLLSQCRTDGSYVVLDRSHPPEGFSLVVSYSNMISHFEIEITDYCKVKVDQAEFDSMPELLGHCKSIGLQLGANIIRLGHALRMDRRFDVTPTRVVFAYYPTLFVSPAILSHSL